MQITIAKQNYLNLYADIKDLHAKIEHVLDKHDMFNIDEVIISPPTNVYKNISEVLYFLNTKYDTRDIINLNNKLTKEVCSFLVIAVHSKDEYAIVENIEIDVLNLFKIR